MQQGIQKCLPERVEIVSVWRKEILDRQVQDSLVKVVASSQVKLVGNEQDGGATIPKAVSKLCSKVEFESACTH